MQELYRWIDNFDNLDIIQSELISSISHDYKQKTHAFTYPEKYIADRCPTFWNWLRPRLFITTRLMRFYVTAPCSELPPHIDGAPITVPFGLNIPVLNCESTTMTWWQVPNDHIEVFQDHRNYGYMSSYKLVEGAKDTAEIIERIEIDRPCFVRNDIMHSVENNRDTWRIMLSIRFPLHKTRWRTLEEVMNLQNLFTD
jgi:hypothetical protein